MGDNAKRLAITIQGGVSLGAYEAGVITEVLALLEYNNQKGGTPWYIDVLGGASAGSITAAVLATALIDQKNVGLLEDVWTNRLNFKDLVKDAPNNTLLNSVFVSKVATDLLGVPPTPNPHPALRPNSARIGLALTLSALGSDLQQLLTAQGSLFRYADQAKVAQFDITVRGGQLGFMSYGTGAYALANGAAKGGVLQGQDAFDALREVAVTSGAFPFAFAPRVLNRWVDGAWKKLAFVDGGVYDNEPVGKTINLAHDVDWDSANPGCDDADRRFLIISPEPIPEPGPDIPGPSAITPPNLLDMKLFDFLGTLVPEILAQSTGSGLDGIDQINRAIADRTKVLGNLEYVLHTTGGNINFDLNILNALVAAAAKVRKLDSKIQFFAENFIDDLRQADLGVWGAANRLQGNRREMFVALGLLIDFVANLVDKVKFQPIVVAPAEPLSGDPFYGFAGFFLDQIRQSDFNQGLKDAYDTWSRERDVTDPDFKMDPKRPDPPDALPPGWRDNPVFRGPYDVAQTQFEGRISTVVGTGIAGPVLGPVLGKLFPFGQLIAKFLS